jgi:hypothetical protein
MKSKKSQKLSGWHRLWILVSALYFLMVLSVAIFIFNTEKDKFVEDIHLKYIEAVYQHKLKININNLISKIKTYLMQNHDIENLIVNQFRLSLKTQSESIYLTIQCKNNYHFGDDKDSITLKYPKSTKVYDICNSLGKFLFESIKRPDFIKMRYDYYNDMTDSRIIQKSKEKYGNEIDFNNIEKNIEQNIKNFRNKTIVIAFLVWIVPVLILYLLGVSIGWVIKGFKKS